MMVILKCPKHVAIAFFGRC